MQNYRVIFTVLTLGLAMTVGAAGSQDAKSSSGSTSKFSGLKKVTLKLATIYAPDHPVSQGIDQMVKTCFAKSEGTLEIQHFPAAQIGNEPSIHEGMRNGSVDMAVMGISEVGKRFEPVLVFDAPFIFRDSDHMRKGFESEVGKKLWSDYETKSGIKMLYPIYYGTRQLTTNKPVSNTAELKGMKIRVPDQPNSVNLWKALGAVPTPMNLGEVYLSLQTGVVDGQENPLATIISSKFFEVCKYINQTNHSVQSVPLFMTVKSFNSLDPVLRTVLMDAITTDIAGINAKIKEYEVVELERLQANNGIKVVKTNYEDFKKAAQDIITKGEAAWGKGIYDQLQQIK